MSKITIFLIYLRHGLIWCRYNVRPTPRQDPPERVSTTSKKPAFANVYAYVGIFINMHDINHDVNDLI